MGEGAGPLLPVRRPTPPLLSGRAGEPGGVVGGVETKALESVGPGPVFLFLTNPFSTLSRTDHKPCWRPHPHPYLPTPLEAPCPLKALRPRPSSLPNPSGLESDRRVYGRTLEDWSRRRAVGGGETTDQNEVCGRGRRGAFTGVGGPSFNVYRSVVGPPILTLEPRSDGPKLGPDTVESPGTKGKDPITNRVVGCEGVSQHS